VKKETRGAEASPAAKMKKESKKEEHEGSMLAGCEEKRRKEGLESSAQNHAKMSE